TKLFRPSMCLTPSAIARMAVSNSRACWRSIADRSAAYCAAMRVRAMASAAFEPAAPIPAPAEAAPAPDAPDGSATPERVRADSRSGVRRSSSQAAESLEWPVVMVWLVQLEQRTPQRQE